ncbi:MAG: nicotinamide-nucleotide amidase [Candidatus Petromonas sp.]|nr:nicotinamide-nucleotide amidase [Candidatus Petromonas sp.]
MGQIVNSNAAFLSQQLNELGYNVLYHLTVGDNPNRLRKIFNDAISFSDIIITTGGLGPTQDDLTKEIISDCLSRKLVFDKSSYSKIQEFFQKINRHMTNNNLKQAYVPQNSIVLENTMGTAPGFIIEDLGKIIVCLPGPPKEMKNMYLNLVKPYLSNKSENIIASKIIKFFGLGESSLESALEDLITHQTNPTLATYAKDGELSLRITAKGKSYEMTDSLINPLIEEINERLGNYIYSYNNKSLQEVVANMLITKNLSISLAESCTGGLLSAKLTSIPGISKVLDRSIITYSNKAKIEELGVNKRIIENYGAVSKETAIAMAEGLKKVTNSDICVSITGIAGPAGGSPEKPVGLVYIGISTNKGTLYKKFNIHGDRTRIRNYATLLALNMIRQTIIN